MIFNVTTLLNKKSDFEKKFENTKKNLINEKRLYIRHKVSPDGDCGYTSFGITRKHAYELLCINIQKIRHLIIPVVKETILLEKFINYLKNKEIINKNTTLELIVANLNKFASDAAIISGYLAYDVMEKQIDAGWAHPAILQALACIRNIELCIWGLDKDGQLVPHKQKQYATFIPDKREQGLDLLFINGNHFEYLEFPENASNSYYPKEIFKKENNFNQLQNHEEKIEIKDIKPNVSDLNKIELPFVSGLPFYKFEDSQGVIFFKKINDNKNITFERLNLKREDFVKEILNYKNLEKSSLNKEIADFLLSKDPKFIKEQANLQQYVFKNNFLEFKKEYYKKSKEISIEIIGDLNSKEKKLSEKEDQELIKLKKEQLSIKGVLEYYEETRELLNITLQKIKKTYPGKFNDDSLNDILNKLDNFNDQNKFKTELNKKNDDFELAKAFLLSVCNSKEVSEKYLQFYINFNIPIGIQSYLIFLNAKKDNYCLYTENSKNNLKLVNNTNMEESKNEVQNILLKDARNFSYLAPISKEEVDNYKLVHEFSRTIIKDALKNCDAKLLELFFINNGLNIDKDDNSELYRGKRQLDFHIEANCDELRIKHYGLKAAVAFTIWQLDKFLKQRTNYINPQNWDKIDRELDKDINERIKEAIRNFKEYLKENRGIIDRKNKTLVNAKLKENEKLLETYLEKFAEETKKILFEYKICCKEEIKSNSQKNIIDYFVNKAERLKIKCEKENEEIANIFLYGANDKFTIKYNMLEQKLEGQFNKINEMLCDKNSTLSKYYNLFKASLLKNNGNLISNKIDIDDEKYKKLFFEKLLHVKLPPNYRNLNNDSIYHLILKTKPIQSVSPKFHILPNSKNNQDTNRIIRKYNDIQVVYSNDNIKINTWENNKSFIENNSEDYQGAEFEKSNLSSLLIYNKKENCWLISWKNQYDQSKNKFNIKIDSNSALGNYIKNKTPDFLRKNILPNNCKLLELKSLIDIYLNNDNNKCKAFLIWASNKKVWYVFGNTKENTWVRKKVGNTIEDFNNKKQNQQEQLDASDEEKVLQGFFWQVKQLECFEVLKKYSVPHDLTNNNGETPLMLIKPQFSNFDMTYNCLRNNANDNYFQKALVIIDDKLKLNKDPTRNNLKNILYNALKKSDFNLVNIFINNLQELEDKKLIILKNLDELLKNEFTHQIKKAFIEFVINETKDLNANNFFDSLQSSNKNHLSQFQNTIEDKFKIFIENQNKFYSIYPKMDAYISKNLESTKKHLSLFNSQINQKLNNLKLKDNFGKKVNNFIKNSSQLDKKDQTKRINSFMVKNFFDLIDDENDSDSDKEKNKLFNKFIEADNKIKTILNNQSNNIINLVDNDARPHFLNKEKILIGKYTDGNDIIIFEEKEEVKPSNLYNVPLNNKDQIVTFEEKQINKKNDDFKKLEIKREEFVETLLTKFNCNGNKGSLSDEKLKVLKYENRRMLRKDIRQELLKQEMPGYNIKAIEIYKEKCKNKNEIIDCLKATYKNKNTEILDSHDLDDIRKWVDVNCTILEKKDIRKAIFELKNAESRIIPMDTRNELQNAINDVEKAKSINKSEVLQNAISNLEKIKSTIKDYYTVLELEYFDKNEDRERLINKIKCKYRKKYPEVDNLKEYTEFNRWLKTGKHGSRKEKEALDRMSDEVSKAEIALYEYCSSEKVFEEYIKGFLNIKKPLTEQSLLLYIKIKEYLFLRLHFNKNKVNFENGESNIVESKQKPKKIFAAMHDKDGNLHVFKSKNSLGKINFETSLNIKAEGFYKILLKGIENDSNRKQILDEIEDITICDGNEEVRKQLLEIRQKINLNDKNLTVETEKNVCKQYINALKQNNLVAKNALIVYCKEQSQTQIRIWFKNKHTAGINLVAASESSISTSNSNGFIDIIFNGNSYNLLTKKYTFKQISSVINSITNEEFNDICNSILENKNYELFSIFLKKTRRVNKNIQDAIKELITRSLKLKDKNQMAIKLLEAFAPHDVESKPLNFPVEFRIEETQVKKITTEIVKAIKNKKIKTGHNDQRQAEKSIYNLIVLCSFYSLDNEKDIKNFFTIINYREAKVKEICKAISESSLRNYSFIFREIAKIFDPITNNMRKINNSVKICERYRETEFNKQDELIKKKFDSNASGWAKTIYKIHEEEQSYFKNLQVTEYDSKNLENNEELNKKDAIIKQEREEKEFLRKELQEGKTKIQGLQNQLNNQNEAYKQTKEELKGTKEELKGTQEELKGTKEELKGTKEELKGTKEELKGTQEELKGTKENLKKVEEQFIKSEENSKQLEKKLVNFEEKFEEKFEESNKNHKKEMEEIKNLILNTNQQKGEKKQQPKKTFEGFLKK